MEREACLLKGGQDTRCHQPAKRITHASPAVVWPHGSTIRNKQRLLGLLFLRHAGLVVLRLQVQGNLCQPAKPERSSLQSRIKQAAHLRVGSLAI